MRLYRIVMYGWTANAAGLTVLAIIAQSWSLVLCAGGCVYCAYVAWRYDQWGS